MKNTTYVETNHFVTLLADKANGDLIKLSIPTESLPHINQMLTSAGMPRFQDWSDEDDIALLFRITNHWYIMHTIQVTFGMFNNAPQEIKKRFLETTQMLHNELTEKGIQVSTGTSEPSAYQHFALELSRILKAAYPGFLPPILVDFPENPPLPPDETILFLLKRFHNSYRDFYVV